MDVALWAVVDGFAADWTRLWAKSTRFQSVTTGRLATNAEKVVFYITIDFSRVAIFCVPKNKKTRVMLTSVTDLPCICKDLCSELPKTRHRLV